MTTAVASPDDVRVRCGIQKSKWRKLEGDDPKRAYEIELAHERFLKETRNGLDWEFQHPAFEIEGEPYITTVQAARALGLGEFHLANLRDRGKLSGRKHGRRSVYSRADLQEFLEPHEGERNAALAASFLRWYDLELQRAS